MHVSQNLFLPALESILKKCRAVGRSPKHLSRPPTQQRNQCRLVMPMQGARQILRPKRQRVGNDQLQQGVHGVHWSIFNHLPA